MLKQAEKYYKPEIVENFLTSDKLDNIISEMEQAYKQNNVEDIIDLTVLVQISFPEVDTITRNKMQDYYQKLASNENRWKWIFLSAYIGASLLLALGYIRQRKEQ